MKKQPTILNEVTTDELLASAPQQVISLRKKIGFVSVILAVVSNCVGAGIFYKSADVLKFSGYNLIISIVVWIVAAITVTCMSLSLVEISSAYRGNLAIVGWCKTFNRTYIYRMCKYFMVYIYLPFNFFFMSLYVFMSLQNALIYFGLRDNFGTNSDWAIWSLLSIFLTVWFLASSGLSNKFFTVQNYIIASAKFIPLVAAVAIGFTIAISDHFTNVPLSTNFNHWNDLSKANGNFFMISPLFGFFGSLASIFFAYDGFYASAGIQSEMKEPRKTPRAIVIGLAITSIVFLVIAINMSVVGKNASLTTFSDYLKKHNISWIGGIVNLLVAVGVCGFINALAVWAPHFVKELIDVGEIKVPFRWMNKYRHHHAPIVGFVYVLLISLPTIIALDIIGGLGYFASLEYINLYDGVGCSSTAKLYNFANLISTWSSVFAFSFIVCAIFSGIVNRRTKRIVIAKKNKYFLWTAWVSVIVVVASLVASVSQPVVNIFLIIFVDRLADVNQLVGNIIVIMMLLAFFGFGVFLYCQEKYQRVNSKPESLSIT